MKTRLGLQENIGQFSLLVLANAFVGAMAGLERSLLPIVAEEHFGITSVLLIMAFIGAFGAAKALANYLTGRLSNRFGRKNLLLLGWFMAIPIPFMLWYAPSWNWIIAANILLGIHQGFAWSSTVIMKIDLVGERQRGFAMGLNEFSGYVAVALAAFTTASLAQHFEALYIIIYGATGLIVAGILLTIFFIKDTRRHAAMEAVESCREKMPNIFLGTTWRGKNLSAVTQAGLINNLNDAMVWGVLPIILHKQGYSLSTIGMVVGLYPFIWGVAQVFTGKWSDIVSKKQMLILGMLMQSVGIFGFVLASNIESYLVFSGLLGLGTAMVYPVFLSTIADNTHPEQRAESIGVFRLWRDLGYLFGALLTGILLDSAGPSAGLLIIGLLTGLSALILYFRMVATLPCQGTAPISIGRFLKFNLLQLITKKTCLHSKLIN